MFLSPYQTTACRTQITKSIVEEVRRAHSQQDLVMPLRAENLEPFHADNVWLVGSKANTKQFGQILTPLELDRPEDPKFVADARYCLSMNRLTKEEGVRAPLDYNRLTQHLTLMNRWWDGYEGRMDLMKISTIPGRVFAVYLSKKVANRFNLDLETELVMSVVSAWYYYCLFHTTEELDQRARERSYNLITQWVGVPVARIVSIVQDLPVVEDIAGYIDMLRTVVGGPVIENLTPGILMSFVGTGWYDHTGKENMAVALEYPPTWVHMCLSAVDSRAHRRSDVGQLVMQLAARNGDQFLRNYKLLRANK